MAVCVCIGACVCVASVAVAFIISTNSLCYDKINTVEIEKIEE